MLAYLGTRPRTSYLGRVRNPNPAMPGAEHIGHTSVFEEEPAETSAAAEKPARRDNAGPPTSNHADCHDA